MIKITSSLLVIALLFLTHNGLSQAGSTCLVAEYKLDGDAKDNSDNNKHGALTGTTPTTDRFGVANHALHFNGISDFVQLGTDADFPERTISAWFKADTFTLSWGTIFTTDNSTMKFGGTGINVDSFGGGKRINAGVGANGIHVWDPKKDRWYQYAIVVSFAFVKHYLNGKLLDSLPNNSLTHSFDGDKLARLGTSRKGDHFFKGSIDDVKIYACPLSMAEMKVLYAGYHEPLHTAKSLINIYPNPSSDWVSIEKNDPSKDVMLSVYTVHGQLLIEYIIKDSFAKLDISSYAKGIYMLEAKTDKGSSVIKLLKD